MLNFKVCLTYFSNEKNQTLKNILEYLLFLLLSYLFRIIGAKLSRKFAPLFVFVFYSLIKLRVDVVRKNIKIAFPELTVEERENLVKKCYRSVSITIIEILRLPAINEKEAAKIFSIDKPEIILEEYNKGKGLIIVTGHFGNWEYGAMLTGFFLKKSINVLVQEQRNPFVSNWMNKQRSKFGNKLIPQGIAVKEIFIALKNGEIAGLAADQRAPEDGVKVKFFNTETEAYRGVAALSVRTGAPLVMAMLVRNNDFTYELKVAKVDDGNLPQDKEEKIIALTQAHISYLEKYIKLFPDHWLWMHDRWKNLKE